MNDQESEFRCLNCGGTTFKRVETSLTLTGLEKSTTVKGLVDQQCLNCGEIRAMPGLLERVEASLRVKNFERG